MRRAGHGTASAPVISRMASMKSASEISKPSPASPAPPAPAAAVAAAPRPGSSSSPGWQAPAAYASTPCAGAASACVGASCCGGCCGGCCACCWSPVRECQCRSATSTIQYGTPSTSEETYADCSRTRAAGETRPLRPEAIHEHGPDRKVTRLLRHSPRGHPARSPGRACGSAPLPSCASPVLP